MCPYNRGMDPARIAELSHIARTAIAERNAAIIEAAHEGIPKHVVVDATGLTKEQVRKIERAGNAPKRPAGRPYKDA